jgi:hypothetical protein
LRSPTAGERSAAAGARLESGEVALREDGHGCRGGGEKCISIILQSIFKDL